MVKLFSLTAVWVVSSATRTKSVTSATAAAKRTLDGILAQVDSQVTPGVREQAVDMLNELNEEVKPLIVQGHADTQFALDDAFARLMSATGDAVTSNNVAIEKDNEWDRCVTFEQDLYRNVEVEEQLLAETQNDKSSVCAVVNTPASKDIMERLPGMDQFACQHDTEGGCQPNLESFEQLKEERFTALRSLVAERVQAYQSNLNACNEATAREVDGQQRLAAAMDAFTHQSETCRRLDTERAANICSFGATLQSKCALSDEFSALVQEVNTPGSVHSFQDRDHEFETSSATSCALQHFLDTGSAPTDAVVQACKDSAPSVGTLNLHQNEFDRSLGAVRCDQEQFEFSGVSWTVPSSESVTSAGYQKVAPFTYQFSEQSTSPPFPICSGGNSQISQCETVNMRLLNLDQPAPERTSITVNDENILIVTGSGNLDLWTHGRKGSPFAWMESPSDEVYTLEVDCRIIRGPGALIAVVSVYDGPDGDHLFPFTFGPRTWHGDGVGYQTMGKDDYRHGPNPGKGMNVREWQRVRVVRRPGVSYDLAFKGDNGEWVQIFDSKSDFQFNPQGTRIGLGFKQNGSQEGEVQFRNLVVHAGEPDVCA